MEQQHTRKHIRDFEWFRLLEETEPDSGGCEIEVAGVRYPTKASLRPSYDASAERMRS